MANIEVRLPQWGMGMTEGTVVEWHFAVGDKVAKGDELVDIDTAKAVQAVESPAAGVLSRIYAEAEAVVPVLELLAEIDDETVAQGTS
jgi:pyruvate/2-oxoglutarate dehydrogenase complex dihydrolipoamide acyltransferase (E2) component